MFKITKAQSEIAKLSMALLTYLLELKKIVKPVCLCLQNPIRVKLQS